MKFQCDSTFSPDTRRPTRVSQSAQDFHRPERPVPPERPIGPLPPKPLLKPILLPASETARTTTPTPKLPSPSQDEEPETISLSHPQEYEPPSQSPRKEMPPAPSPRRILSTDIRERAERAQSVSEGLIYCQLTVDLLSDILASDSQFLLNTWFNWMAAWLVDLFLSLSYFLALCVYNTRTHSLHDTHHCLNKFVILE